MSWWKQEKMAKIIIKLLTMKEDQFFCLFCFVIKRSQMYSKCKLHEKCSQLLHRISGSDLSLLMCKLTSLTCWGQEGELITLAAAKICFSYFTCTWDQLVGKKNERNLEVLKWNISFKSFIMFKESRSRRLSYYSVRCRSWSFTLWRKVKKTQAQKALYNASSQLCNPLPGKKKKILSEWCSNHFTHSSMKFHHHYLSLDDCTDVVWP